MESRRYIMPACNYNMHQSVPRTKYEAKFDLLVVTDVGMAGLTRIYVDCTLQAESVEQ
jgi:hypothetical protein